MSKAVSCIFTIRLEERVVASGGALVGNCKVEDIKANNNILQSVIDAMTKKILGDIPKDIEPLRDKIDLVLFFPDLLN